MLKYYVGLSHKIFDMYLFTCKVKLIQLAQHEYKTISLCK